MTQKPKLEAKTRVRPVAPMGLGLFIDPRAEESGKRACSAALQFLEKIDVKIASIDRLDSDLIALSRNYWAAYDYDTQTSYGQIKAELKPTLVLLRNLRQNLDGLSKPTKIAVNRAIINKRRRRQSFDYIGKTIMEIGSVKDEIDDIVSKSYSKLPATRFRKSINLVKEIWKQTTGRDFSVTKERAPTQENAAHQFTNNDVQFAYIVMSAIDNAVTLKNVSSALQMPSSTAEEK